MPATKPDRRVLRTRELLLDSFISLLVERGYEKMTVQHLLDRASVGRATFYAHFRNKEDLLSASVGRLEVGLRRAWKKGHAETGPSSEPLGFTRAFFRHIDGHRAILHQIVGRVSEVTVDRQIRRMLSRLVRDDLVACGRAKRGSAALEFTVQFVVGALWSIIVWWAAARSGPTPDELNELFHRLALPGLDAISRQNIAW